MRARTIRLVLLLTSAGGTIYGIATGHWMLVLTIIAGGGLALAFLIGSWADELRLLSKGLVPKPSATWAVALDSELLEVQVANTTYTINQESLVDGKLFIDGTLDGPGRMVSVLRLRLQDAQDLLIPETARGFYELVTALERNGQLTRTVV